MRRTTNVVTALLMAGSVTLYAACSDDDAGAGGGGGGDQDAGGDVNVGPVAVGPSHGSAVALSADDTTAVIVNRDVGSVTVLRLAFAEGQPPTPNKVAELDLGKGSEPWQAVISPDGKTAYVVLRHAQQVVRIDNLTTSPSVGPRVAVGSEPTGIALTPTGATAFVTNWVDGTISGVDTASMSVKTTIDLNATLVGTGFLGAVAPRPGLAHPRSIAITNNGDANDADEFMYVTEYFAQQIAPELPDGSNADTHKIGLVYRVPVAGGVPSAITLSPLADMGFKDDRNQPAGCYPNQLQSITINGKWAYVVSVCASPKGPIGPKVTTTACTDVSQCTGLVDPVCVLPTATAPNKVCVDVASVKTVTAPLVSVIDLSLAQPQEVSVAAANLNAKFRDLFASRAVPDAGPPVQERYPLFGMDMDFVPGTGVGYVAANGADAVFRVVFEPTSGTITEVGASTNLFIDLAPAGIAEGNAGKNPIGIAIGHTGKQFGIVANDVSRNATIIDFKTQAVAGLANGEPRVIGTSALPAKGSEDEKVLLGKRFFNTGLGRWSFKGQGWGACQSCHPDGLTDNVTWYFARGPRQSTSLDGTFNSKDPSDQRVLNWTGIFDELADFEGNTRGVSGGVGAIVSAKSTPLSTADRIDLAATGANHAGLNGSAAKAADPSNPLGLPAPSLLTDWAEITKFVQRIRSPRGVTGLDAAKVAEGRRLFVDEAGCQGCHGGGKWTVSKLFYDPSPAASEALKTKPWPNLNGFPQVLLPALTPANQVMRFGGSNPAAMDQILCAMRNVGTFGVAEEGVGIAELRADMSTPAQGNGDPAANNDGKGYNPPSLLGLQVGAPYMHAGNARTLEALFTPTFAKHHAAFAPNFLADTDAAVLRRKIEAMVAFLLTIDEGTEPVAIPALGPQGGSFCEGP